MSDAYGRHRESVEDIEEELMDIFLSHPDAELNEHEVPDIPSAAVPSILKTWAEQHGSEDLLSEDELNQFMELLTTHSIDRVQPALIMGIVAVRGNDSPRKELPDPPEEYHEHEGFHGEGHSRSASIESTGTSVGPPVPPKWSSPPESPFEAKNRQRSQPLNAPPSSWSGRRPVPASHVRRRSDADSTSGYALSDSESQPDVPNRRHSMRARAPSNPVSPSSPSFGLYSASPHNSRPPSRTQSQRDYYHGSHGTTSPDLESPGSLASSMQPLSLHFRRGSGHGSDDEDDRDSTARMGPLHPSMPSSLTHAQEEDLRRNIADLERRLTQSNQNLSRQEADFDSEVIRLQDRIDEQKAELVTLNREKHDLDAKERAGTQQIQKLEEEIAKVQRSLDNTKVQYANLQRQYQEQCAESEKYRNTLRVRDDDIKRAKDLNDRQAQDLTKLHADLKTAEESRSQLQAEVALLREAADSLELQKQENLLLKETIDRMRFELDELTNSSSAAAMGTAPGSQQTTLSKSLGAEFARSVRGADDNKKEDRAEDGDGESTEGEEEIQTIITRKRKVPGRANKANNTFEETTKEYSDAYTQHETSEFSASQEIQTEPQPAPEPIVQANPVPAVAERVMATSQIQTDDVEPMAVALNPSMMASTSSSSSKAILDVVPHVHEADLPPSYSESFQDGDDPSSVTDPKLRFRLTVAQETLRRWHQGSKIPVEPVPHGISAESLEAWLKLKQELGVDCSVIDKIIKASPIIPAAPNKSKLIKDKDARRSSISSRAIPVAAAAVGVAALIAILSQPSGVEYIMTMPGGPVHLDRPFWTALQNLPVAVGRGAPGSEATFDVFSRVLISSARAAAGQLR
ncbi:hypothetical protein SISNIDRAFT_550525 [Sistotremastrum niveocremeum HHB9708]|uniref:Uncharacterized protein n=2 Tax=Sistotremastraceae TaxID=3402574 RepID=A0A164TPC9_9AGAM|nr:hypothetical protein SISNIDRAFT_550525 [Sistotremastrum niveocremeum HHB9708]KZT42197.1 hypothetical protein SISSUDRAFT_1016331 [Sistotremastrum suecicum HHB10207 ss-3]